MGCTSTSGCCCFNLKTGGLILGYLSLVWAVFVFLIGPIGFGFNFWYCLFLSSVVVAWLYGIHDNKYIYMLVYLIYSVIVTAIFCICFAVVTFAALFGFSLIDSVLQQASSAAGFKLISGIFQTAHLFGAGIFIFLFWFIVALITAINWYYTVVMIALYRQMKAESLGQLPSSMMTQNIQLSQIGSFGDSPLASQAGNVGFHPQVAQTDCLQVVETTK